MRMMRLAGYAVAAVLLAGTAMMPWSARGAETTVELDLYPLKGGELVYRGLRTVREEGGLVSVSTVFTTPAGKPVQDVKAVYDADGLVPISYSLRDARSGEEETLRREGDEVHMSYRASASDKPETDSVTLHPSMLITAAVVPFVQRNWQPLMDGGTLTFILLVPSRQDTYQFRLVKDDSGKSGTAADTMVVRMEPDTWLVRQLVDPMYFVLETAPPHRAREFRGRSSIKTNDGKDQDLRYVYRYPAGS